MRLTPAIKSMALLLFALHIHHRFHGPPIGYAGVALAAAASWVGVPGPGEPVLVAAGVLAAQHKLDIASVLGSAWLGATLGGIAGWLIGMKAGRAVLTTRGPLHRVRLRALKRGDRIFERYTIIAVLLTPSWIAGIHRVRSPVYQPTNAAGAALWAVMFGLGAYYVGPPLVDLFNDAGTFAGIAVIVVIVAIFVLELFLYRRRRRRRGEAGATAGPS